MKVLFLYALKDVLRRKKRLADITDKNNSLVPDGCAGTGKLICRIFYLSLKTATGIYFVWCVIMFPPVLIPYFLFNWIAYRVRNKMQLTVSKKSAVKKLKQENQKFKTASLFLNHINMTAVFTDNKITTGQWS